MREFKKLVNLAALRAFEAAARHDNFSRAADELFLTHGAISHQVRALEQELGVALFDRNGKRVRLNEVGRAYAVSIRRALRDIASATDKACATSRQTRLTITTIPSFGARWLAPRLGGYMALYPECEVRLESSGQLVDFERESVDAGIRFGNGNYPGLSVELLMHDHHYLVASPTFRDGKLPTTPAEVLQCPLLRSDYEFWQPWFTAAGMAQPEPVGGIVYSDASMLVRAAIEGQGIGLGRHSVVQSDIAAGSLVRLFQTSVACPQAYYFVCPLNALQRPQVQAFRKWLVQEIAQWQEANPVET
jgi:LysR family glycine cleavage system transcriptional activator